ncbi:MAG: PP2C family protein-serine/threonine phosphatase [Desulforhopalus sp.]
MYDQFAFQSYLEHWENTFKATDPTHSVHFQKENCIKRIKEQVISLNDLNHTIQLNCGQDYNLKFRKCVDLNGLDVCGKTMPYGGFIGGDYFDFHWRLDSRKEALSVAVGDSSGHGPESAPLMLTVREFIKARASQPGPISDVISEMNSYITSSVQHTGNFMTLFYLTIDTKNRDLLWVRAGHEAGLVYDPTSETIEELKGNGVALGIADEFEYEEYTQSKLIDGQVIVVATDGFYEALNERGEMFSKNRLCNIIKENSKKPAKDILAAAFNELLKFTEKSQLQDDVTLVVIKAGGTNCYLPHSDHKNGVFLPN